MGYKMSRDEFNARPEQEKDEWCMNRCGQTLRNCACSPAPEVSRPGRLPSSSTFMPR